MLEKFQGLMTFQTFGEKDERNNKSLCRIVHQYDQALFEDLNKKGAGIYFMFNEGNGSGRNNKSVVKIRGIFQEDDHGCEAHLPLEPHFIVQTSPGKFHRHFLVHGLSQDDYKQLMGLMILEYGSDPNAKDLARVLRVPGFVNHKSGFTVQVIHESGHPPYSRDEVMTAFLHMPTIKKVVGALATKTHDDPYFSRNLAVYQLGHRLAEEDVPSELLVKALRMFEANMRPTDTSGQIKGMDFDHEMVSITRGWTESNDEKQKMFEIQMDAENIVPLKFPLLTYDELMLKPMLKWFIKDILPTAEIGFIYGDSGTGKTFYTIHMIKSLLKGNCTFFGKKVGAPATVLYICAEGASGFRDRLQLAIGDMTAEEKDRLRIIDRKPNLGRVVDVKEIISSCRHHSFIPQLIFIDTLAQTSGGSDQNSSTEMQLYLDCVGKLNATFNSMSIIIHHTGKDPSKGMRGASCLRAAADMSIVLSGPKTGPKTAAIDKMKDGADDFEMYFELKPQTIAIGFEEDGEDTSRTSCVLVELDEKPEEVIEERPVEHGPREKQVLSFVRGEGYLPLSIAAISKKLAAEHGLDRTDVFSRATKSLISKGYLEIVNNLVEPGFM